MEEVLNKLGSAQIGGDNKSGFEDLYKNWGKLSGQEERRRDLLEKQKCNRNTNLDAYRGILELVNCVDHIDDKDIFHSNKRTHYRPNIYVAGFNKVSSSYRNVLMISEWMIEKPENFEQEWYVVPCPKGVRLLVISNRGKTKCYTKTGHYHSEIHSALPGGTQYNSVSYSKSHSCCVLDCFYNEKSDIMYVLDFLAWNNQPMTECDTEFRYFWLKSQFAEIPELSTISKANKVQFSLLPKVQCSPKEFNEFMTTYPHFDGKTEIDGLLFYHKKAHYVSGQTPLVGWLYPYMVPEVLGQDIAVHANYLKKKPEGYVNQMEYIKEFEEQMANKKYRRRPSRRESMDTTSSGDVAAQKEMDEDGVDEKSEKIDKRKNDEITEKGVENLDVD